MSDPIGETWAGTYRFEARELVSARSVAEVQEAVRSRTGPVRALGTRHSFNDIADTAGTLISVLDVPPDPRMSADGERRHGRRRHPLRRTGGLARAARPGAAQHGVAPAHLGGRRGRDRHPRFGRPQLRLLADAVQAIEYVDAAGELQRVERDDPRFGGFVVGLGAYGIVTRVDLAVEPTSACGRASRGVGWDVLAERFDEVTGCRARACRCSPLWAPADRVRAREDSASTRRSRIRAGHRSRQADGGERRSTRRQCDPAGRQRAGPVADCACRTSGSMRAVVRRRDPVRVLRARAHAPAALRAVRELGRHRSAPDHTEIRTIAADDLWLARRTGATRCHPLHVGRPPRAVGAAAAAIEEALRRSTRGRTGASATRSTPPASRPRTRASPTPGRCSSELDPEGVS